MSSYESISIEEAAEKILSFTRHISRTETVGLLEAQGRILAGDRIAEFDNPPFDRSPVDGYACRHEDTSDASHEHPAILKVVEEVDAGGFSERIIGRGEAVRIMTGAAVPSGCDCCIRQEDTDYGEDLVSIYHPSKQWENYCFAGEDFKKGTVLLEKGTKLGYVELAVLAGLGRAEVPVFCKPRIAILTSGDEVVNPGEPLAPGKIYNSNQTLLAARLAEYGTKPWCMESVKDEPAVMAERIRDIAPQVDLIVTTGGVSVGKKDIMHEALRMIGAERIFWGVGVKPGMPTLFSVCQGTPVISLSGNPFGVAVTVELLVRPAIGKMTGDPDLALRRVSGIMADDFPKKIKGRRMIRARFADGRFYLPDGLHSNGVLSSMTGCNCLIDTGTELSGKRLETGMKAEAILL